MKMDKKLELGGLLGQAQLIKN